MCALGSFCVLCCCCSYSLFYSSLLQCLHSFLQVLQKNCLNTRVSSYISYFIFSWKLSKTLPAWTVQATTVSQSLRNVLFTCTRWLAQILYSLGFFFFQLSILCVFSRLSFNSLLFGVFRFVFPSIFIVRSFFHGIRFALHCFGLVRFGLVWFGFGWHLFFFLLLCSLLSATLFLMVLMCIIVVHTVRCDTI